MTSIAASHYDVLGVDASSSLEQLRHAYRAAAKASHPDRGGSPEAFARVQQAWEQLRDPQRRAAYDRDLASLAGSQSGTAAAGPMTSASRPRPATGERYVPAPAGRRRRRSVVAGPVIVAALAGTVTTWGLAQLGRPGVLAAGVFLSLSLGSLGARATGLDVGRGTYRVTQRAAWLLTGLLAAIATSFWMLDRDDAVVPAAGAACVALYAAAVALLWRQLQRRA